TDNHELYASFSQGFDLPDVGLQLRNARAGFDLQWFDDFQPLSQSRLARPATVDGGRISYDAFMYNAGVMFQPTDNHELYASFSQGFDLPDVGLQLRNARAGFDL
ncbi:hypothetical protein CTI14_58220, partial [Methylobacterium radiotolerans]